MGKLAAAPDDEALLSQAVALMSRAKCDGDFYFSIAEKYYQVKPSSETPCSWPKLSRTRSDYAKATYLNEALDVEQTPPSVRSLLVRIALVGLVANDIADAASAARQARDLNPEDGVPYFVLAQCYASSAARLRRICRTGNLLGCIRHDVQGRRAASERFGVPGARQDVAECIPQPFPELGGVLLQRVAGGRPLYGELRYGSRCFDDGTSSLSLFGNAFPWGNA